MARPVVLVHGAWHGAWCWERVAPMLDRAGVPWVAPDLPTCANADAGPTYADDVAEVTRALDTLPGNEPSVLAGHSYGGMVISGAGSHPRVGHLVYLAALMVEPGETMTAYMAGSGVRDALIVRDDRASIPDPARGAAVFYNDCTGDDIAFAATRLRYMSSSRAVHETAAWQSKPSTYVICAKDRAILPESQRKMAARAGTVLEWDTGHSPFLNRPELVAALLIGLATG